MGTMNAGARFSVALAAAVFTCAAWSAALSVASETPRVIEGIRVETGVEGKVGIFFKLNGFFVPTCFAIPGEHPRFVCDFVDARLAEGIESKIETDSDILQRIRIGGHMEPERKVRVVLDLDPERDFEIEQIFVKEDKEYVLVVQPD
jgi:hypothetical protein